MRRKRHRGFAIAFALGAVGIVAAALVTMTSLLAAQSVRSRAELRQGQLRQLLVAGAACVVQDARIWTGPPTASESAIPLPHELSAEGATLKLRRSVGSDGIVLVEIQAILANNRMTESIRFSNSGGHFRPEGVVFDKP
jgi:hypothetical protein